MSKKPSTRLAGLAATASLLTGLALLVISAGVVTPWVFASAVTCVASVASLVWRATLNRRRGKIDGALSLLDGIYQGTRFVGANSQALATKRFDTNEPGRFRVEQLCKTAAGQWFHFSFTVRDGSRSAFDFEVVPFSLAEARNWLSYDLDAYKRHFGEPEIA